MKTFEGKLVPKSIKVGIVAARFNEFITSKLLSGALDGLLRHEVREDDVHVAWVPGAFEIPLVAAKMARSGRYDAVICLGSAAPPATMTTSATRSPRGSPPCLWKAACQFSLAY